jgi:hypothetical protein
MERVGTLARDRLGDVATRAWNCGRGGKFQRREIIDWAGPGELKILKRRIFPWGGAKVRPWRYQKDNVPQGCSGYGCAWDTAFDPAISEKICS